MKDIRKDFAIIRNNPTYVYLDNGATSLTPDSVTAAMQDYYDNFSCNVHRGGYRRAVDASRIIDETREKVANFFGAKFSEIVFTRNASDSLSMAMQLLVWNDVVRPGERLLVGRSEHHSNFLPWLLLRRKGIHVDLIELDEQARVDLDDLQQKLRSTSYKAVCLTHVSNVTGNVTDISAVSRLVKESGALLVVDGSQAVPHFKLDLSSLGVDFYAFSAHKMLGPTGLGVLYINEEVSPRLYPVSLGGGTVSHVNDDSFELLDMPSRFEPGTPNIAGIFGMGACIDYLDTISLDRWSTEESEWNERALARFAEIPTARVFGSRNVDERIGTFAFELEGISADDVATILDRSFNIAVRAGMHCAQPLINRLNPDGVCRMSYYLYNTWEELDYFFGAVSEIGKSAITSCKA